MNKMLKTIATNAVLFLLLVAISFLIDILFFETDGRLVLVMVVVHLLVMLVVAMWHFTQRDFYLGRAYLFSILLLLAFMLILGAIAFRVVLSGIRLHY